MLVNYQGSIGLTNLHVECNVPMDAIFANVASACGRGVDEVESAEPHNTPLLLVGGGPSLADTIPQIREMKEAGAKIFAHNNAAKYLSQLGIEVDGHVIIDSRPENVRFVEECWAKTLYISSQCHPSLFDKAESIGYPVEMWHPIIDGIEKHIPTESPLLIGGGLTVGLSAMCLSYTLGYREMHLFGYDSCHSESGSHAYSQPMNDTDEITEVVVDNRVFRCSVTMAAQANSFQKIAEMLADLNCLIYVHGEGLIPYIYERMTREEWVMTAVYDLMVSPPTFDFVSFLMEAERARIAHGADKIDVIFQPGPMNGFRHDKLPPDVPTREGMLHRVCVALCRLLPSVRNVSVLKDRQHVKGDVFPEGYDVESNPLNHYGTVHFKNSRPVFHATESARRIARKFGRFATITLRQSSAWSTRNSQLGEWLKVAEWLMSKGITPVFIPGEYGEAPKEYESCDAALLDVDVRMALYEASVINLGSNSGPMAILFGMESPYIIFKPCVESSPVANKEFLAAVGFNEGDQFSSNGKTVWADDEAETIIREVGDFLRTQPLEG